MHNLTSTNYQCAINSGSSIHNSHNYQYSISSDSSYNSHNLGHRSVYHKSKVNLNNPHNLSQDKNLINE
jgi:hypothetical protein